MKKQYGSLVPDQAPELKQQQEENIRLKKLVADLSLDKRHLAGRRCKKCTVQMLRSALYYLPVRDARPELRRRMKELVQTKIRYGYRRLHALLKREGWPIDGYVGLPPWSSTGLQQAWQADRQQLRRNLQRHLARRMPELELVRLSD